MARIFFRAIFLFYSNFLSPRDPATDAASAPVSLSNPPAFKPHLSPQCR